MSLFGGKAVQLLLTQSDIGELASLKPPPQMGRLLERRAFAMISAFCYDDCYHTTNTGALASARTCDV